MSFDIKRKKSVLACWLKATGRTHKCRKHVNIGWCTLPVQYMGSPLMDCIDILFGDRHLWHNHMYQIWRWSVNGFRAGLVPKFVFSHRLCWSSLQQSYATTCTVIIKPSTQLLTLKANKLHGRSSFKFRVRTIPNKAPNIQYPIILASSDTNTQYQYWYYCVA